MGDHECEEAVEKLYEYLDGELDGPTMQEVEAHLTKCSPCLEAFDFQDQLRKVVRDKCSEEMPYAMKSRILDFLGEASPMPGAEPSA